MIGALVFNLIAVFFAWLESSRLFKHGLKFSLFTIFLFLALRYDYGNDYQRYLVFFSDVVTRANQGSFSPSIRGNEIGWFYLNLAFSPLGFFAMIAALAALTSFVLYRFIRKYVPPQYYWFAVFFYVFQPYNMLILSSAMRQEVSIIIFIVALDFIIRKKIIIYFVLIFIATLFHSSAAILYPFILLGFYRWSIKLYYILIAFLIFMLIVIFNRELFSIVELITIGYFDFYTGALDLAEFKVNVGLGFALNIGFYLLSLFYAQKDTDINNNILYQLTIISLLLIPIGFVVPLMSRLNFYLIPTMMAVFSITITKMNKSIIRFGFISLFILFTCYQFYYFFQSETWKMDYGEYHTIFSSYHIY